VPSVVLQGHLLSVSLKAFYVGVECRSLQDSFLWQALFPPPAASSLLVLYLLTNGGNVSMFTTMDGHRHPTASFTRGPLINRQDNDFTANSNSSEYLDNDFTTKSAEKGVCVCHRTFNSPCAKCFVFLNRGSPTSINGLKMRKKLVGFLSIDKIGPVQFCRFK
jgi:hypothetical protein